MQLHGLTNGVLLAAGIVLAQAACSSSEGDAAGSSGGASSGGTSSGGTSSGGTSGGTSSGGTSSGGVPGPGTMHAGCRIFPNDNAWNRDVSSDPVDAELTASVMPSMAPSRGLHADWGTVSDGYGIPITVGKAASPAPITWSTTWGRRESDKLACPNAADGEFCYPIPLDARIEGGTGAPSGADRHILFLANDGAPDSCVLYELYNAQNPEGGGFTAASGAIWKLDSNALRTEGWTSADAAGLPILPGLVRREEVEKGEITHAIRFTMNRTRHAFIHPATHAAGRDDASLPPMGLRVRLKASVDPAKFSGAAKVIVTAMRKYGLILADNGSDWYISGESDERWGPDMGDINDQLGGVKGSDFEVVKTGPIIPQPD